MQQGTHVQHAACTHTQNKQPPSSRLGGTYIACVGVAVAQFPRLVTLRRLTSFFPSFASRMQALGRTMD